MFRFLRPRSATICCRYVAAFAVIVLLAWGPAAVCAEQAAPAQTNVSPLEKQNLKEFMEWRASMPDYERRLYDRVKNLNGRTLEVLRTVIAVAAVIILILIGIGYQLSRQISALRLGAMQGGTAHDAMPAALDHGYMRGVARRQRQILDSLSRIDDYIVHADKVPEGFEQLMRSIKKAANELDSDLRSPPAERTLDRQST